MPRSAPRVACLGVASWDRLLKVSRFPVPGEQVVVGEEMSAAGGTTTNTAVALARLGVATSVIAAVGDDATGHEMRRHLVQEGVDVTSLQMRPDARSNAATILISDDPPERTILWHRGAQLSRGDRLPIDAIFGHDLVVLDPPDASLRRWLLDLPAHTVPRTRLLGTLTYLADDSIPDAFDLALRHDVIVGNEKDALAVTGTWTIADATAALRHRMAGHTLRAAIITRGNAGCRIVTANENWQLPAFPADVVDPTGAGDAFAAGVAYGLVHRWEWPRLGRFANAMGALAVRAIGAQAALPIAAEAELLLAKYPRDLNETWPPPPPSGVGHGKPR